MIRAAGVLYIAADGRALFLKRGPSGDHAGEWCFPGGKIEGDETPEAAARREFEEETGKPIKGALVLWSRRIDSSAVANTISIPGAGIVGMPVAGVDAVDFTTFICRDGETFEPTPNDEHVGFAWAPVASPPEPLHPGCRIALDKLGMDELGIARAIAANQLASPQRYENVALFALRITGTGTAYRKGIDEFVYRRPENYLTDEFLARCNGLPVVLEHPKKRTLDSQEFSDRVVGTILLPYLCGDEVWGIAKIYDDATAKMMTEEQLSTSPAVIFRDLSVNENLKLEDGSKLLIEGKPSLLDHLAICERGVWDKGDGPTGVRTDSNGDKTMTPAEIAAKAKKDAEAKAAAAAAGVRADADDKPEGDKKADADGGTVPDKVLAALDSISAKMDSVCGRMDSFEAKEKERADAEAKAKADAEESERTSKMSEDDKKADKARKDAEEAEKKEKADAEAKEKADAEARAKADADISTIKKDVDELKAKTAARSDDERAKFADAQAKADAVYHAFGDSAPRPLDGETLLDYRRRLVAKLKPHSKQWKGVDLAAFTDAAAIEVVEGQIFADALVAASNPTDLPEGQLREIVSTDSTGRRISNFVGSKTYIHAMKRPGKRVAAFNTRRDH